MQSFLSVSGAQTRLLESMLFDGVSPASDIRYVPVLLVESESTAVGGAQWEIRTPRDGDPGIAQAVDAGARNAVLAALPTLPWGPADADARARIAAEFRTLVGQAGLQERVQAHVLRLFGATAWQVMQRGRP